MDRSRVTCLDCASAQAGECVRTGFGCTLQERVAPRVVPETAGGFRLPEESHSLQIALGAVIGQWRPGFKCGAIVTPIPSPSASSARKAAIEINLTSNSFILGVKEANHPVTLYLRHGIPVVISSDDMGVSRNNLSNEYILFASRYQPNYDQLKSIVYNSIRYSFLSEADKQKHLRLLDQKFLQFEAKVAGLK